MLDVIYLGLYKLFAFFIWLLPESWFRGFIRFLAKFAYYASSKRRKIIHDNLDLAFQDSMSENQKKQIGVFAYMNLLDTTFGLMKRDKMDIDEVMKNVSFDGADIVEKYQKQGKPFLFISGHYGNWELIAPAIAAKFDITFVVVGRKLDSDVMDNVLKASRETFNVELVYKNGATKGCIRAINKGKTVGILTDQSIRKNQSVDVTFFDKQATHTPLASILSRKFEMDMIPIYISTDDYKTYKVKIYEPIATIKTDNAEDDLALLTQQQADVMEKVIREDPKQWFWMHKRWKGFKHEV
ncbi:MAG: lipid A biosynthesis lauroyl acyltransferase [Campylobacterota bacterium]|nr:lipid A biosynthesis lauroyl acyltransferase [Campylobacterota bacterium]